MLIKYNIEIALGLFTPKNRIMCLVFEKDNQISLPVTWLDSHKSLLDSAKRLSLKLTDIDPDWLNIKPINVFDSPNRYPQRTITHLFASYIAETVPLAQGYKWFSLEDIMKRKDEVFSDHLIMLQQAIWRI